MTDDATPPVGRRVTIGFIPHATADLDWLAAYKQAKKNDMANRAVQVYAFIERELAKGKKLMFENPDGSTETVNII